jgi:hypothetical protein
MLFTRFLWQHVVMFLDLVHYYHNLQCLKRYNHLSFRKLETSTCKVQNRVNICVGQCILIFLPGCIKCIQLIYRMVNSRQASSNRVATLCIQLLSHLLAGILQTLHSYGHIEDVFMCLFDTVWTFFEKFTCSWT